jgi:hypothetical protein
MTKKRTYNRHFVRDGKYTIVPCTVHSYAWSGKMPCTGIRVCVFCGKPEEDN